jgi:hypothetical protein
MALFQKFTKLRKRLLGRPVTARYSQFPDQAYTHVRDLPLFTFHTIRYMLIDPTLRLGLAMRAAPLHQAEFARRTIGPDGKIKWVPGIKADRQDVGEFVLRQLRRIWRFDLHKILSAQIWGWSAGEVTYRLKDGLVEVDRILTRSARDVFALRSQKEGKVLGVRFHRIGGGVGEADLFFPKCFWHAYNPEAESPYGVSILKGAHSPWADKWLNGGALDVRRLFAHKDAYGGVEIYYPPGTTNIDGKGEVPNRDVMREMAEQMKSGNVVTLPSERLEGQLMWEVKRAQIPANPTHIFDYPKDLDTEMLRGIEVPDDVVTSDSGGVLLGSAGKQIPMLAFYTNGDKWLAQVLESLITQVIEPLVLLNWGRAEFFEVTTKPLAEQAMDQINTAEEPGEMRPDSQQGQAGESADVQRGRKIFERRNPDFGQSLQLALDETTGGTVAELLTGRGVLDASRLVEAGRKLLDEGNGQCHAQKP